jgi:thiol-disulfide isomerase/thioredoxin
MTQHAQTMNASNDARHSNNTRESRRLILGTALAATAAGVGLSWYKASLDPPAADALSGFYEQRWLWANPPADARAGTDAAMFDMSSTKGKALVVNFWAPWCAPCVEEMPELSALSETWSRQYGNKTLTLGIGIDSPSAVQRFAKNRPVKYPLVATGVEGMSLLSRLGNDAGGLPFTVLINPAGKITERILGRFKGPALSKSLAEMLS